MSPAVLALLRSRLAAQLSAAKASIEASVRSLVVVAIAVVIAAALVLIGLIFAVLGLYQTLLAHVEPWQAGAFIAAGAIVLAALVVLIAKLSIRRSAPRAKAQDPPPRASDADVDLAAQVGASVGELFGRGRPSSVQLGIAAFIAGLVLSLFRRRGPRDEDAGDGGGSRASG